MVATEPVIAMTRLGLLVDYRRSVYDFIFFPKNIIQIVPQYIFIRLIQWDD